MSIRCVAYENIENSLGEYLFLGVFEQFARHSIDTDKSTAESIQKTASPVASIVS